MADPTTQTCPICSVQIVPGGAGGDGNALPTEDRVIFSTGPTGTRAKLWARVCQYTKQSGCINKQGKDETISADDYYKDAPATDISS